MVEKEEDDTERRAFLAFLAATGAGLIDLERLAAPAVDAAYLHDAEALTTALLGQWYAATPAVLLPPALAHLRGLQRALPGPAALENLTGRTALLVGHLFDKAWPGSGRRPSRSYTSAAVGGGLVARWKQPTRAAAPRSRSRSSSRAGLPRSPTPTRFTRASERRATRTGSTGRCCCPTTGTSPRS